MAAKTSPGWAVATAPLIAMLVSLNADAQCCGTATTAYYQPAAYTAYSPPVYSAYRTGWYPGYFLDRIRTRVFGSPSTYVASYPSTYVASYPSAYVASYPSTYVASYPSAYAASYPAYTATYATAAAPVSACPTCSTCTSCTAGYAPCETCATVQQVSMRPVGGCEPCTTCSSCSGCSSGTYGVSQASYDQGSGCAGCGGGGGSGTTIVVPNGTVMTPGSQRAAQSTGQPEIPAAEPTPMERTLQKPSGGEGQGAQDGTGADGGSNTPPQTSEGAGSGASYFEAPTLFNPKDHTAQRKVGPVRTALYQQPAGFRRASMPPTKITAAQAKRDAAGWTSAAH